ncbi:hypothetical protein [Ferruginivarius sediminum]|uniref:Uncharacterized protein n=1 Tax=Ferruginivarius sediminum TaxID=2661937 RepID=A0A369TFV8_9PROT|nr:hypothetical protein [Ferruginivarius sediminum]RDD63484.1 hypothetical protein DRB17_03310 [Ferruginivarius sediminum]
MAENEVIIGEGTGVEVARIITHHGFFFGHYDAELEQRQLPASDGLDASKVNWPEQAILLRVMHRITRVRRIWDEDFPGEVESVKSKRVYLCKGAEVVRSRKDLERFKRQLRDYDGADRLLKLGNVEAVVVVPERRLWGKMRQGETVGGQAG